MNLKRNFFLVCLFSLMCNVSTVRGSQLVNASMGLCKDVVSSMSGVSWPQALLIGVSSLALAVAANGSDHMWQQFKENERIKEEKHKQNDDLVEEKCAAETPDSLSEYLLKGCKNPKKFVEGMPKNYWVRRGAVVFLGALALFSGLMRGSTLGPKAVLHVIVSFASLALLLVSYRCYVKEKDEVGADYDNIRWKEDFIPKLIALSPFALSLALFW